jgi:hypothetical protein
MGAVYVGAHVTPHFDQLALEAAARTVPAVER